MPNRREEVYNVKLAELLAARGASQAEAERSHAHDMPDVLFEWFGLAVVLEAKYDESGSATAVGRQVADRLATGFGTLGIALLYPSALKGATGDVGRKLDAASLRVQLSSVGRSPSPWHDLNGVEGLVAVLDQARASLIDDDELQSSVELLSTAVDSLARTLAAQPGHAETMVQLVTAVVDAPKFTVTSEEKEASFRVAALAMITATIVQQVLSDRDAAVPSVVGTAPNEQRRALLAGWKTILEHDYAAIFEIAYEVLSIMGDSDGRMGPALVAMIDQADQVVARGVFGRHDLVGRVYHGLLTAQKYLATYYTSVPAATLLAAIATAPSKWPDVDWAAETQIFDFRVADPACGTGTLLAAALGATRRHYVSARRQSGKAVDASDLGRRLIEDNIYGFDILAYAVQVCASTLLLSSSGTVVTGSHLYQLPFGGTSGHLGSLDMLIGPAQGTLFGAWGDSVTIDGVVGKNVPINAPIVDLVVMNPPFTRTQGGSRLLGSLSPDEWPNARKNLGRLAARPDVEGRVVAGLGALFVPLADRLVRNHGRLALVLPKTMLTGVQWDLTRQLLSSRYHVEMIICSHEPGRWNFSDSTSLAEIILIAKKLAQDEDRDSLETIWVQLTQNPKNPIDALGVATALLRMGSPSPHGEPIVLGSGQLPTFGQAFSRPSPVDSSPWRHATFSNASLDLAATTMADFKAVTLPRVERAINLPLKRLSSIAEVGPDRARLHDGFSHAGAASEYACLWGHSAEQDRMAATPNIWLIPSDHREAEHARRYAAELWAGASRLLVAERLRLNTHRTAAVLLSDPALANTMWPVRLHDSDDDAYRILCLWLNSTLGLVAWVGASEETEGPWLSMKKNKLLDLPVIDCAALTPDARAELVSCWSKTHELPLSPIGKLVEDTVRADIDGALSRVLGIPADGLDAVRQLYSAEPRLSRVRPALKVPKQ